MKYLIFTFILVSPLFYVVGVELRQAQEILFQLSAMAMLFVALLCK